jgi:HEAT repeat protein
VVALVGVLGGCSNKQKKLSSGDDMLGQLYYDVLGGERAPSYYFDILQNSHEAETFCYRCDDDPYLVDKNVDAITRLGGAPYGRLEGLANTIVLMVEVLLEDPSALARSQAAVSLTRIGAKLPRYATRGPVDDGSALAQAIAEIQGIYTSRQSAAYRDRLAQLLAQVGEASYDPGVYAKKALQLFGTTPGLVEERDPGVRVALETAIVKVARQAIVYGLTAAVEGPTDFVRADAVRGLKVLGEVSGVDEVRARVRVEVSAHVRGEAVEYFARAATPEAVEGLVLLLDDIDGSVRWRARQALMRVAGQDLGARRGPWERWARGRWPGLAFPEEAPADPLLPQPG